jgi:hypothetical protein
MVVMPVLNFPLRRVRNNSAFEDTFSFGLFICSGKQLAISLKARCLRVSKKERNGLSRICFEMTRQATMRACLERVFVAWCVISKQILLRT